MPATSQRSGRRADADSCWAHEIGGANCESQAAGPRGCDRVGMQSHSMTEVEIKSSSRSNGQTPTCTCPIRATMPWRTAADSIRARTAFSSMGLSNSAARLTTSAAAIAPPSHHRRPRVRNVTIDAGCHSRIAREAAGRPDADVDLAGRCGFRRGAGGLPQLSSITLQRNSVAVPEASSSE